MCCNYIFRLSFYPRRLTRAQRAGTQSWSSLCCPQNEAETGKQVPTRTERSRPFPWSLLRNWPTWARSSCVTVKSFMTDYTTSLVKVCFSATIYRCNISLPAVPRSLGPLLQFPARFAHSLERTLLVQMVWLSV